MRSQTQCDLFAVRLPSPDQDSHRPLREWFDAKIGQPTDIQRRAWPKITKGENALLIAPTGQGKSLAAWLPIVERAIRKQSGRSRLQALHIAPLKALARDMTHNLEALMQAASAVCGRTMRMELRCGDTPAAERRLQMRKSPHFLATTPETLFILLGSSSGRRWLSSVRTVVVDEIHALAPGKRGAHLALSLERLEQIANRKLQRIGLSATAAPQRRLARFLCGGRDCRVVAAASSQVPQVQVESLDSPLGPFAHHGHWQQVYDRLAELSQASPNPLAGMLVFCATRRQVERTAAALAKRLGADQVGAHHGSLDRKHRELIEQRFRQGELAVIVSSASLELGLDLGQIDRVCQLGGIGSINQLCQRAGRSRHRPGARPLVHLFPLTLNQRLEAEALTEALEQGEVEPTETILAPLDVLAQHLVAIVAAEPGQWRLDTLLSWCQQAWPWRNFTSAELDSLLNMLCAHRVSGTNGKQPLLSRNVDGVLHASDGADRLAMTNAGTIPEWFEYEVLESPDGPVLGKLDEEFAFESSVGDIVQLGNRPFRIVRTMPGQLWVERLSNVDAHVPFWFGDGVSRSPQLVQRMLRQFDAAVPAACAQTVDWLRQCRDVLGTLPGPDRLIIERFPDPNGDPHLVIHSFAGARLNRAWGLALRKRFCRQFNFELQAAATDDGILISLGTTGQFEVEDIVRFVHSKAARNVLIQALLDTPLFVTRFRWCANHALSVLRFNQSGPVSAQIQRNCTENLIEQVFPDQLACLENLSGPREVPDHPLVQQALHDCLHQHMDVDGLEHLLFRIEQGEVEVVSLDLPEPSPLAEALIHAPPNSFLDPAAAEERRTRSFESRPGSPFQSRRSGEVGHSSRSTAVTVPTKRLANHGTQALLDLLDEVGYLTRAEGESGIGLHGQHISGGWTTAFQALTAKREAFAVSIDRNRCVWASMANLAAVQCMLSGAEIRPWLPDSLMPKESIDPDQALIKLMLGRMRAFGGINPGQMADDLMCSHRRIEELVGRVQSQLA